MAAYKAKQPKTFRQLTYQRPYLAKTCIRCWQLVMRDGFRKPSDSECRGCDQERSRQWRSQNPERQRKLVADWKIRSLEKVRGTTRRRALRLATSGIYEVTAKDERRLRSSPCFACGATSDITLDHAIPVSRGGRHSVGNLIPLCRTCNSRKSAKLWVEFRMTVTARSPKSLRIARASLMESLNNAV